MPLKFIRKVTADDALHLAISTTSITKELSSMMLFPPATAAVSVLLLIFQTIQDVQTNKDGCIRLARRAARILLDINEQMAGRWDSAPEMLLKNLDRFKDTLIDIQRFMKSEVEAKWHSRFVRKTSIDSALKDYNALLDDASQSFQIATLINIHYAVSAQPGRVTEKQGTVAKGDSLTLPPYSISASSPKQLPLLGATPLGTNDVKTLVASPIEETFVSAVEEEADEQLVSDDVLEDHGFRRYHQSEIALHGRSKLKDGWWAGATEAHVDGQSSLVKRYEGVRSQAIKHWLRDVRMLQNIYHPNLPQMVGYSEEGTPTPFILLSNVQTRSAQALVLNTLRSQSLASCAELMLHFYRDISDATLYVQRQMNLTNEQAQDFLEGASYRVSSQKTLILGLPPPKDGVWATVRNYGLAESLKSACMNMLPGKGTISYTLAAEEEDADLTNKIRHLVTLANGLLPGARDKPSLSSRVEALLGDGDEEDDEPKSSRLSLRQVRLSNLEANAHDHAWIRKSVAPHTFNPGDLGYIPRGQGFQAFVKLCNVIKDGRISCAIEDNSFGEQWCWNSFPMRREPIDCYDLSFSTKCWPVAVPPATQIDVMVIHETYFARTGDGWKFLLDHGKQMASEFSVDPQDLILVTGVGTTQDFYIRHIDSGLHARHPNHAHHRQAFGHQHGAFGHTRGGFGRPGAQPFFPQQPIMPTIMYLLTSPDPNYAPHWSHKPTAMPAGAAVPELPRGWTYKIGWNMGSIRYVQMHADDFVG